MAPETNSAWISANRLEAFYSEVLPELNRCRLERLERDRVVAHRFNVFNYIKPNENLLSDILSDLLDPSGAHGQGATFLNSFLRAINVPERSVHKRCKVKREDLTPASRRIDITIELDTFAIGIENKPWHVESNQQLHDYWEHLQRRYGSECILVYLPGDERDPISLSRADVKGLIDAGKFRSLAWSGKLLQQWLQVCHDDCKAEKVRLFLEDFADYVYREFGRQGDEEADTP